MIPGKAWSSEEKTIFFTDEAGPGLALSPWGQRVLGCALALTTATRFRLPGLPLGAGELLLVVLMSSGLYMLAIRRRLAQALGVQGGRNVLLLWGALFFCLGTGALWGRAQGVFVPHVAMREAAALGFCALYALWLSTLRWDSESMLRVLVVCGVIVLAGNMVFVIAEYVSYGPMWFAKHFSLNRFLTGSKSALGWTNNINQAMLPLVLAAPLCFAQVLDFRSNGCRGTKNCLLAIATVLMFAFGLLMFSRSFALFVLALLCFFALYGLVPAPRTRAVANRLFVVFVAVAICSYGAAAAYAMTTQGIVLGAARHVLLLNGLRALGDSLGLGFGPGAFSGLNQPFEGMEVHNLFVDIALSGGAAGFLVLAGVFALSARAAMRLPHKRWLCVWGGMFIMVMLHNLLRHPIFWTALLCPLLLDGWGARTTVVAASEGRA